MHLYSIDICNGWKINVSDVPVNVNKIKPILKGTQHVLSGVATDCTFVVMMMVIRIFFHFFFTSCVMVLREN